MPGNPTPNYDGSGLPTVPSSITWNVLYKRPNALTNEPEPVDVDVGSQRIKITRNGQLVTVDAIDAAGPDLNGAYTPTKVIGVTGLYSFTFLTTGLQEGLYDLLWSGTAPVGPSLTTHTLTVSGQVGIGAVTRLQDFINRVRYRLMDDHPVDYQIDQRGVNHWSKVELFSCLRDALSRINNTGPRITSNTFDSIPTEDLLVTGGMVYALYARARFEGANTMDYSDGHTLRIDRGPFYKQLADTFSKDWLDAVVSWKKATPPTPIGIRTQQIPFRLFRVIGMLPNYQTYFGG